MYAFKGFILAVLVLFTASLCSCGSRNNNDSDVERNDDGSELQWFDSEDLDFVETNFIQRQQGFGFSAAVGNRTYFFGAHEEEEQWEWDFYPQLTAEHANVAAIRSVESMIAAIEYMVDLGTELRRVFWIEGQDQYVFELNAARTNFDDMNTFGWLVYSWSLGRLPMWLSAGLEAVARADTGSFVPDGVDAVPPIFVLRDLGFAHINWGSPVQLQSVTAAYYFVRYLHDTGQLAEIVSQYLSSNIVQANALALAAHESGNFGFDFCTMLRLRYHVYFDPLAHLALSSDSEDGTVELWFNGDSEEVGYFLAEAQFEDYFQIAWQAIGDVSEWFEKYLPLAGIHGFEREPAQVSFVVEPPSLAAFGSNFARNAVIWTGGRVARELEPSFVIWEDYAPLWMGFAAALAELFFPLPVGDWVESVRPVLGDSGNRAGGAADDAIITAVSAMNISTFHLFAYGHVFQMDMTNDEAREWFESQRAAYESWEGPAFPGVNTGNKSMSFVLYLLQEHGSERYIQLHVAPDRFEELYGMPVEEMVGMWHQFLVETVETLRAALRNMEQ